jgi:hypothetical protein
MSNFTHIRSASNAMSPRIE